MHNLQIGIYKFSRGCTPPPASLYLLHGALRLGVLSSPIEMYATIGPGIFALEKEIYVTIVFGIFVLENYNWPLPRNDPEGMADTPNLLEKN